MTTEKINNKIHNYQRVGRVAFSISDTLGQVFRFLGIVAFIVGTAGLLSGTVADCCEIKIRKAKQKLNNNNNKKK